jgi:FKBP-type peptidyl-prolyl cis-trans isomerase
MNKSVIQILVLVLAVTLFNVDAQAQKKKKKKKKNTKTTEQVVLTNKIDSVSYAVGFNMGQSIKKEFAEGNIVALIAGLKAIINDTVYVIPQEQMQPLVSTYFQEKQQKQLVEQQAEQAKHQAEQEKENQAVKLAGEQFLAENKTKEGVITTASGLQYIVLKEGSGKQPTATSKVEVHYHGTTPDGTVFDSSVERGQPITFPLNGVIPGWTEGVQLMKEGAKYKFFIPQELAYGARGAQGTPIKPFMALVFEVELIRIVE